MTKVVQFTRKPGVGHFSIEGTFSAMREVLRRDLDVALEVCPRMSQGIFPRIQNVLAARGRQGDVNHILGDVHYLTLGMDKRRTVLTVCDCSFAYHPNRIKRLLLRLFWLLLPARRVARICAISEKTKQEILSLVDVPEDLIAVIPVCISDKFQFKDHLFRKERPVILQVGTGWNKNVVRLIEALRGIECVLHLIGALRPEISAALEKNNVDCVHEEGLPQDGIIRAYAEADIVVFVSTYEGFGMPIVEANAVGRAVVTSRIEPMLDVAGEAAVFVEPQSVESIRAGIVSLIEDPGLRESMIRKGLINANRFRTEVVAAQYLRVFQDVSSAGASR